MANNVISDRTKIPLSFVIFVITATVGLASAAGVQQYKTGDHDHRLEKVESHEEEHDRRIQHQEDNSIVMKDLLLDIKAEIKEMRKEAKEKR